MDYSNSFYMLIRDSRREKKLSNMGMIEMNTDLDKVLCIDCMDTQGYHIEFDREEREVKGEKIPFNRRYAVCNKCGSRVTVPGLDDENEKSFERVYRSLHGYIQVEEIKKILKKYHIEKRPLAKVLGLGEHTIEKYLEGQLPSKRYSELLKNILEDHNTMREFFEANRNTITGKAANYLDQALEQMDNINSVDTKIEKVSHYIAMSDYEITNLSMQKLLYYTDGFAQVILGRCIFEDNCEAWAYGPVYPSIYRKYKCFDNERIEVEKTDCELVDAEEKSVIDVVLRCFAVYNGLFLKTLTHNEDPWKTSRQGYDEYDRCNNIISKQRIRAYFKRIDESYKLTDSDNVKAYIDSISHIA